MNNALLPVAVNAGSLDRFIQAAYQAPYLTAEEETELAMRWAQNQDMDAARQLVMSHLRYVVHVARNYGGYGLPLADLIQEGAIGLMKAVRRFDIGRGVRLVSFATHWIRAEIHEYVLKNWHIVKIATTKAQRKLFFNLRSQKEALGRVKIEEANRIAESLGVAAEEVFEMDARMAEKATSFEGFADQDDEDQFAPEDYLAAANAEPAELIEREEWDLRQNQKLARALGNLDTRSRDILETRWLTENKAGLKQLGEKYGVSAERIRQLEHQAMNRLREELTEH